MTWGDNLCQELTLKLAEARGHQRVLHNPDVPVEDWETPPGGKRKPTREEATRLAEQVRATSLTGLENRIQALGDKQPQASLVLIEILLQKLDDSTPRGIHTPTPV